MTRFLDRNQYCINFSLRCNYACSYCINQAGKGKAKSVVENSTFNLIRLFNDVEPGVIMVSGGEPTLWYDMPKLIRELPQHKWVILTNLSFIPSWLLHPNVVLVIAAYHFFQTDADAFIWRVKSLPRAMVKILVDPRDEANPVEMWYHLTERGILTHLAPMEWPRPHSEWMLELVSGDLLTSCMYSARFFSNDYTKERPCIAGTRDMFQVGPNGNITRCSQSGAGPISKIFKPEFYDKPQPCNRSCYCEWHHWGDMTLANENSRWNKYIETGVWDRPTPTELQFFIEGMGWTPLLSS